MCISFIAAFIIVAWNERCTSNRFTRLYYLWYGPTSSWNNTGTCKYFLSQWPRGLRRRSTAARLLCSWVRNPLGVWMFVCCECCQSSLRQADHSSRGVVPTVVCCVWSRKTNFVNEEADIVSSDSLTTAARSRKSSTNTRCCVCSF